MDLPFDSALDLQVEQLLREMEASGVVIIDREVKKRWIKDLVSRGFSLQLIFQTLKAYNFDFKSTSIYFSSLYMSQQKSKEALAEVTTIKANIEKEKEQQKLSAKVSWVITAFATSAVGFMTAIMVGNATEGLDTSALIGPANNMLTWFTRGGWIIGFAGLGIGLLLGTFFLGSYLKKRIHKEESEIQQKKQGIAETEKKVKEQMVQLSAEIAAAHQPARQPSPQVQQPMQRPQGLP
ncbi:hypothetical protein HY501_00010 [Candidatus Woesearchaeota archaeon]|nr:hypothetical protein [Candidatus Woesearchaeota archaeon]